MTRVVHITPHLGGGVGKAISSLVRQAATSTAGIEHSIVCLERPEKLQFVERIRQAGCAVTVCPTPSELFQAMEEADIVQLEFWNHPALVQALCTAPLPAMRLIVWCHISGLHYPRIPPRLLVEAHKFLFTSKCSFEATEVVDLESCHAAKLGVISSGSGLETPPQRPAFTGRLRFGYVGSLNFAKLHPDYISYLATVDVPDFHVRLIGDETNRAVLEAQCRRLGRPELLQFRGYCTDVAAELAELDVLLYLLNPTHYGTAENALLEAMAMEVVPVVLDNPAERCIVEHRRTGLVIQTPSELAEAVDWLSQHSEERLAMAKRAAVGVRGRYTKQRMENSFNGYYAEVLSEPKRVVPFREIFGDVPADWFRAFCRDFSIFSDSGAVSVSGDYSCHAFFERTKGSVFQFFDYFPGDKRLRSWVGGLQQSSAQGAAIK